MSDQRAFTNCVRSLFNIDGYLLPELTTEQQTQFIRDPVRYFINADKAQQDAIWREVRKRQPSKEQAVDPLVEVLENLSDLFAHEGESSLDRFERLAAMFRKDTGYLAPGKDAPAAGAVQPDGDELRRIYDDWYNAKIACARAAIAKARTSDREVA